MQGDRSRVCRVIRRGQRVGQARHGPKATPDPSLIPTTCTGERPWLLVEPTLSLDLRQRIETWLELEDAGTARPASVTATARQLVGQAMGSLMERFDLNGDRSFTVLKRYSQDNNRNCATSPKNSSTPANCPANCCGAAR